MPPNAVISLHQLLMNRAYSKWDDDVVAYSDFIDQLPIEERFAVLLGNLNYQVCNGGFGQWVGNGYAVKIVQLHHVLIVMDTDSSRAVASDLATIQLMLNKSGTDFLSWEDAEYSINQMSERYFAGEETLMNEAEVFLAGKS